jgi:hypothetical protein
MKTEDYTMNIEIKLLIVKLSTPKVGPISMFYTMSWIDIHVLQNEAQNYTRRKCMMFTCRTFSLKPPLPQFVAPSFCFSKFHSGFQILKKPELPNGLPPPLDIAGKRDNSRNISELIPSQRL